MWKFIIVAVLTTSISSAPTDDCTEAQIAAFENFKKEYGKTYATPDQEAQALKCYCNADNEIQEFNNNPSNSFKLGHNDRSDLCKKVRSSNGLIMDSNSSHPIDMSKKVRAGQEARGFTKINGGKDFRNRTGVVIDQGSCGSCWAVSALHVIHYYQWLKIKKQRTLSYSNILDCNSYKMGCQGGNPGAALQYCYEKGLALESRYKSSAKVAKCRISNKIKPVFKLDRPAAGGQLNGNEDLLQMTLDSFGPAVVVINGVCNSLVRYSSGIYDDPSCNPSDINHGVTLVGYGTDAKTKTKFWILKNSWGTSWGEGGYFRVKRGVNSMGIGTAAFLPCPPGNC